MSRERVAYLSGVHGGGKSTLVKALLAQYPEDYVLSERIPIPKSDNVFEREKIRLSRYYMMTYHEDELLAKHPNKVILADRCALDTLGYARAFVALGWETPEQYCQLHQIYKLLFEPERREKNVILLDPPFEEVVKNIKGRWKKMGLVKWREGNFVYLQAAAQGLREIYSLEAVSLLHITDVNLEDRVKKVREFTERLLPAYSESGSPKNS